MATRPPKFLEMLSPKRKSSGFLSILAMSEFPAYLGKILVNYLNGLSYDMEKKIFPSSYNKKEEEKANAVVKQYAAAIDVIRTAINLKEVLTEESIKKACAKVQDMGLDGERFEIVAMRIKKKYEEQ